MAIENEKDGSLVQQVAKLVHPTPTILRLADGRELWTAGEKKEIFGVAEEPEPVPLVVSTLSAVVDLWNGDASYQTDGALIHVSSPTNVRVVLPDTGEARQQFVYLLSTANVPTLRLSDYTNMDAFAVAVLTTFAATPDRARLLEYAGSLNAGIVGGVEDDGLTQTATARKGVTQTSKVRLANPLMLAPYRTFAEIAQPASAFVLRLKAVKSGDEVEAQAALIEADGGAWRVAAITGVGDWLRERLPEATILA